ncbi:hypothetical protein BC936DRAFT_138555 [Jimgerdemannia flammicorona]|uniref:Uncharacterized protein n=1 Tax=Jimgerdemannia flammicorona TaxID=994334 RepID=A0A433C4U0_9FUNG|nr:hypothetical protein BC936DRAFT_138555 [Jimgerdemannia flammicorona]
MCVNELWMHINFTGPFRPNPKLWVDPILSKCVLLLSTLSYPLSALSYPPKPDDAMCSPRSTLYHRTPWALGPSRPIDITKGRGSILDMACVTVKLPGLELSFQPSPVQKSSNEK